jgi:hypothetical protein
VLDHRKARGLSKCGESVGGAWGLELNDRCRLRSGRWTRKSRLTKKGRKSPLSSHGWISSPERRETARSGYSLTVNDYPALDADAGLLDVTCLRSA